MKFSIDRNYLLHNLNYVFRGVSSKPQMPILTGIKLEVKENGIILTSSNSDISIQAILNETNHFNIMETGTVVLPGKYLLDGLRKTDAQSVSFTLFEKNNVKIIAAKATFTLNVLDKDAFPYISFDESPTTLVLDAINVKQIIKKTAFATSISESKMVLTGVSLSTNGPKLEAIATDSFRLAKKYIICDVENPQINLIIPSKNLEELNKILEEVEEMVHIHFFKTKVIFKYKNIVFSSRLIEGTFPNTNSLIPTEYITSVKFNKNELISVIDRASLFNANDTTSIIKLIMNGAENIEINSVSNEIGVTSEEITPISCTNKLSFQIAFSSKYFLDAIKAFDSNEITIHLTGEIKPFIITGEYDVNHIQLILPVRVS